jgi:hypothetical protein
MAGVYFRFKEEIEMAFRQLPRGDQEIVLECLEAIAEGAGISEWEFSGRVGIKRATLRKIISEWPEIDDLRIESDGFLAINNCLNEACHGISIAPDEWGIWFSASKEKVKQTYHRWMQLQEESE